MLGAAGAAAGGARPAQSADVLLVVSGPVTWAEIAQVRVVAAEARARGGPRVTLVGLGGVEARVHVGAA